MNGNGSVQTEAGRSLADMIADAMSTVLPSSAATLFGSVWWILLLAFGLSLLLGWALGRHRRT